jgi:hypothetical protein
MATLEKLIDALYKVEGIDDIINDGGYELDMSDEEDEIYFDFWFMDNEAGLNVSEDILAYSDTWDCGWTEYDPDASDEDNEMYVSGDERRVHHFVIITQQNVDKFTETVEAYIAKHKL